MKLSIITINLNEAEGLERTIKSVLSQSFTHYELIIIDGKSTDNSLAIIKTHEEKIAYWASEKDTGIYHAMNKGIKVAKGEYCYFLNSGDYLATDDVLQKMFEDDAKASFICANFTTLSHGVLATQTPYRNRDWTFSLYDIYAGDLCHQAFFIRRDNFDKYERYDEGLRITSDWRLFFIAIGIHSESVTYRDVNLVIYDLAGLSSWIGGEAIYKERKKTAQELLSKQVADKLDRLYYLEQNSFITDIIKKQKVLYFLFRGYCKLCRMLGIIKTK